MGLFNSPKTPQPPRPNISIHLSTPTDKVFRPNDVVSGTIVFVPVDSIIPRAIEVSLFGKALVWHRTRAVSNNLTNYHHWRDNAPLFEVTKDVLPAFDPKMPRLESGETYSYPFQFVFPANTDNVRHGQYKNDQDSRWTVGPHLLPPSFLHTGEHSAHSGEDADYAKVEYGIRARLVGPGVDIAQGQSLEDLMVTAPVLFVPLHGRLYAYKDPSSARKFSKTFIAQTSVLNGQGQSSIGFRQSVRDRFTSSTPKLDFEVALEVPDILTAGSELCFRASLNAISKTENVLHIPAIRFTILKLDLQDLTSIRAARDFEAFTFSDGHHPKNRGGNMPPPNATFSGQEHIDLSRRETNLNSMPPFVMLELEGSSIGEPTEMQQADSCETWFKAHIPECIPPSFKSFAIAREYGIEVKLGIEIAGKKFEHEIQSHIREMCSAPV